MKPVAAPIRAITHIQNIAPGPPSTTADVEFHEVLYRASRNERLADIVHNLREQTYRFRSFSMNQPGRLRKTWEEHRQLVEAIASHNATQARKLARIHMEHSEQTLLQGMEESPEFTKA